MGDDYDDERLVEEVGPDSSVEPTRQARIAWYRRQAAKIREEAENVKNQTVRRQLLGIARQYDNLATSLERLPLSRAE
jgi:hypothetical protein